MIRFAGGRVREQVIPFGVAVLYLLLTTWVSYADCARHGHDFESFDVQAPAGEGTQTVISSVCFICSAGLGAFSPTVPDSPLTPVVSFSVPAPDVPETLVPSPLRLTKLARAPPLA